MKDSTTKNISVLGQFKIKIMGQCCPTGNAARVAILLPIQFPANVLGKVLEDDLSTLPSSWETRPKLLTPGFQLAQAYCSHLGNEPVGKRAVS